MAEIDMAQIQRMMRAALRSADKGTPSRASSTPPGQEIAPHAAPTPHAAPAPHAPGRASAPRPASSSDPISPPSAPQSVSLSSQSADSVRLSGEGLRRLADAAIQIFLRPGNAARIPQLLENDATRGAVLGILARVAPGTEQAAIVAGALSDPQAVGTLTRLFLSAPLPTEAPRLPFETSEALRILSWPEMANVAKQVFQSAEARAALARILTVVPSPSAQTESSAPPGRPAPTPEHIASIVRMLARPEMAQAAQQIFSFADARNALIALLAPAPASAPAEAAPESSSRISDAASALRILSRVELVDAARDVFSRPEVAARVPEFLARSETRGAMLEILLRPEMADVARRLLAAPGTALRVRRLLSEASAREPLLQTLAQPGLGDLAQRVFSDPEAARLLTRAAGLGDPSDQVPPPTATETDAALRVLAQPEMEAFFRNLMAEAGREARLLQLMAASETRDAVLYLLQEERNAQVAQQLLASPEILGKIPELLADARTRNALLQILARPEALRLSVEILLRPEAQTQLLILLRETGFQEKVRPLFELAEMRPVLQALLDRAERLPVADRADPRAPREAPAFILEMLNRPAGGMSATQARAQGAAQGAGRARRPGGASPAGTVLHAGQTGRPRALVAGRETGAASPLPTAASPTSRAEVAASAEAPGPSVSGPFLSGRGPTGRLASAGPMRFEDLGRTLQMLFLRGLTDPVGPRPQSPASEGAEKSAEASARSLQVLEHGLLRLRAVSPRRAEQALATLSVLARLGGLSAPGGRNMGTVAEQIGRRLERMSDHLALKGGLPRGQTEPALGESALLVVRFEALGGERLVALMKALTGQGIDVVFVGRNAAGDAQIHIQLAGQAPAAGLDVRGPGAPAALPGTIRHAGLRPDEIAALAGLLAAEPSDSGAVSRPGGEAGLRDSASSPAPHRPSAGPAADEPAGEAALRAATAQTQAGARGDGDAVLSLGPDGALRADAASHYAFNPHLAALFPWFSFVASPSPSAVRAGLRTEDGQVIPTMLDLVRDEPLLLGYVPDELVIPGTNIPLILPPEGESYSIR